MSIQKCHKYISKLSNTNIDDEKFVLYLLKLNYWYKQLGGNEPPQTIENNANSICDFNAEKIFDYPEFKDIECNKICDKNNKCTITAENTFCTFFSHSETDCNGTSQEKWKCNWDTKTKSCKGGKPVNEYTKPKKLTKQKKR
jgi:hypothetical protein